MHTKAVSVATFKLWSLIVTAAMMSAAMPQSALSDDAAPQLLRHVVLFQYKEGTTPEQIEEVTKAFAGLKGKISEIVDFECGTDVSVEGKAGGFTHGYVVTFKSEKDRDTYLPHPAHKEFVKLVGPRLQNVLVFDYWVKK